MILYQNGLLQLDYEPATDVLHVTLPSAHLFGVSELQRSLDTIASYIQSYDVKKLLLNSSNTVLHDLDDASYREVVAKFFTDLKRTRLQRIARVGTSTASHEDRSARITSTLKQELYAPFVLETFPNEGKAFQWLLEKN
ncbi:hypothetical protein [Rufibacter latericius]|uniref:STAS/SEC14 domain-containing protein n=1 Tax=Rufibacter latericius TaxID=2487040 RepID=A0A3M9M8G0_9BACT|nr:hypothetical protein [Rufibacter latericius]RNI21859.1 hypothetical protein EFB08_22190 [Rufibacter latericius]